MGILWVGSRGHSLPLPTQGINIVDSGERWVYNPSVVLTSGRAASVGQALATHPGAGFPLRWDGIGAVLFEGPRFFR